MGTRYLQKIERKHLTLRTRLKRLTRQSLCFSRSIKMHDWSLASASIAMTVDTWHKVAVNSSNYNKTPPVGLYPSASHPTEIPETAKIIWRMMQHRRNRLETFR